jgi:NADP-dependent 3-hydroxy acid dehydrogenase YdfG
MDNNARTRRQIRGLTDDRPSKKVAIVTGASQGIGRAVALRLTQVGYVVWAVARRRSVLEQLRAEACPGAIIVADCDLQDPDAVRALTDQLTSQTPDGLSALVHCAGSYIHGDIADTELAFLRQEFLDNVEPAYLLTQQLLPILKPASSVIFLNSSQGLRATAGHGQFGASMHALKAVADALRDEVNGRGVRVTSMYVGRTATPRQRDIYAKNGWCYQPELLLQPEDVALSVVHAVQAPPTAEVTDISIRPALKSY